MVSAGLRRTLELNKINRLGMKTIHAQANCKTVYTSSILVVASINPINDLCRLFERPGKPASTRREAPR